MKKCISLLLSLLLLTSITAGLDFSAYAVTNYKRDVTDDGISYSIDYETEEVTITSGNTEAVNAVIPESIEGYPVTTIGSHAFGGFDNLESIVVPDTVTKIDFCAFNDTVNLKDITMSQNIDKIDMYAFSNNGLVNDKSTWEGNALYIGNILIKVSTDIAGKFTVKNGTRVIAPSAFYDENNNRGCNNMTAVELPDTLVSIGIDAFSHCTSLRSITLPDSIKYLDNCPFHYCTNLATINGDLPNLISAGQGIFSFTAYYYNEDNWEDGILYYKSIVTDSKTDITTAHIKQGTRVLADYAFGCCENITEVTIPDSVRYIGPLAFDDLHLLESLTIPEGVIRIDNNAFDGCLSLKELTIPKSVEYIGLFAFNRTPELKKLTILNPECVIRDNHEEETGGAYSIYNETEVYGYTYSTAETFASNNGVTFNSIGKYKYSGNCGKSATFVCDIQNKTLTISGTGALGSYTSTNRPAWYDDREEIETIIVEDGITNLGHNAFSGFSNVSKVILPEGLEIIGNGTFSNCSSLEELDLPETLTTVTLNAFYNCSSLQSITFPSSTQKIFDQFSGCTSLKNITILSYDCQIGYVNAFPADATISAYDASSAQTYCAEYSLNFNNLGCYHVFVDYVTNDDATCTSDGTKTATCPKCENATDTIPDIDSAKGHDFVLTETVPSTCTEAGSKLYHCSRCEETKTDTIPANGHSYEAVITAPTCNKQGYTTHTCTACGDSYVDTYTEATDSHTYTQTVVAPTCEAKGFTLYTCTVCGKNYKADFKETVAHDYKETVTTLPTCTTKGTKTFTCSVCGDKYTEDIDMLEHTPVTDAAVAATCEKAGLTEGSHCSVCGAVITAQQVVNATGHQYTTATTAPNCRDKGYTTYTCTECNDSYKDNYVDATDEHKYKAAITTLPTCAEEGVTTHTCTVCGNKYTTPIEKLAHTPVTDEAVAPTCTKTGLTEGSHCSVCNKVLVAQEIVDALGHTEVIDEAVPATYTTNGKTEGKHCTVCGAVTVAQQPTARLPKKANTLTVKAKKPTVKFANLKKKNQTIAIKNALTVSNAKGSVTYAKASGNKKITVAKNGKITVKKGLKKGTYKIGIKVTASGNYEYNAGTKTVTVKIKVK